MSRRADRLFAIIQFLRGGRIRRAEDLAERLEVSVRTVYRDIADLAASGVPIDGEAGVGYRLHRGFDIPPLMFTRDELEALTVGARMVRTWAGLDLARAAEDALAKIEAVLPEDLKRSLDASRLFSPTLLRDDAQALRLDDLRRAINERRYLLACYRDPNGTETERRIRPLGLYFWGARWTLAAWCELRADFRNFRPDRFIEYDVLAARYPDEPGRRLSDFLAKMEAT